MIRELDAKRRAPPDEPLLCFIQRARPVAQLRWPPGRIVGFTADRPRCSIILSEIMPLTIGTHLGSHEITALLGKGGMGEVYRARDLKLNRDVAIKILPGDLVDAAARRRFQREAQMASSLNHPHILTVYDAD